MPTPTQGGRTRYDLNGARPRLVSTTELWWTNRFARHFFRNRPSFLCNLIFLKPFQSNTTRTPPGDTSETPRGEEGERGAT